MSRRRFIAGAVCPRCAQLDSIYIYQQDSVDVRACIDCDFEEQANFDRPVKELATRVNQPNDKTVVEIQTIKIINNNKRES